MCNQSQLKILFLTADPIDITRLRLQEELRKIEEKLQLANLRERFLLDYRFSARPGDISQAILNFAPDIVHFSGHGTNIGELCFENESGKMQVVTSQALAAFFEQVADEVQCVVLNACYSDIQAKAIAQHIPFVIGMNKAIGDKAAIAFAVGFYKALGANRSIEKAYKFGCVEIQLEGIPEELTPVLRKKANHSPAVFYLDRPEIEKRCYQEIKQPGSLIRIKAPENMGKTWLMNRIVDYARVNGYKTVTLSCNILIDGTVANNIQTFLRSFCIAVGNEIGLSNQLNQHWESEVTCILNSTNYFQKYLLTNITNPLVLALNDVDIVFEKSAIANDFCNMLRIWYDRAYRGDAASDIWKKLRLIIVHSTEVYTSLNINSSPLEGVGLVVDLPELTKEQVQRLVQLSELNLTRPQINKLMDLLNGHPMLVRTACDYIHLHSSLNKFLKIAPTLEGPYRGHLLELLNRLNNSPDLKSAFRLVVNSGNPIRLDANIARSLQRLGLVKLEGNLVKTRCELYRHFFCELL